MRDELRPSWTKKQRRAFQRIRSGIRIGELSSVPVCHLTLTSAPGTDYAQMNRHWEALRKRIARRYGRFPYCKVKVREGFGVLHVFVRTRRIIPQAWLSCAWETLHSSAIVYIRRLYGSPRKAAMYLAGQYCSQSCFDRLSLSRDWIKVGFPRVWKNCLWRAGVFRGAGMMMEFVPENLPKAFALWDDWLKSIVAEREQLCL